MIYDNENTRLLRSYVGNPASAELLSEMVAAGGLRVLFEFSPKITTETFNTVKNVFNIEKLYSPSDMARLTAEDVDAVFIMIPHPRDLRGRVITWATENRKPLYVLEAGLISSIQTMYNKEGPISYYVDDRSSIYLVGDGDSSLTHYLNSSADLSSQEASEARELIDLITSRGVSKYNFQIIDPPMEAVKNLVIDQSFNDWSITAAESTNETFQKMVEFALAEAGADDVHIKLHPDALTGHRNTTIDMAWARRQKRLKFIVSNVSVDSLLSRADNVYVVSSTVGFEALMRQKRVVVFGKSFYGGWGLTDDRVTFSNRQRTRTIEELVHAVFLRQTFFMDPITYRTAKPMDALRSFCRLLDSYRISQLAFNHTFDQLNRRLLYAEKKLEESQSRIRDLEGKNVRKKRKGRSGILSAFLRRIRG